MQQLPKTFAHCSLLELLSKGMQRDDCPYIDKQCKEIITYAVLSCFLVLCYKHKASISYLINLQPQYIQLQILPEKTNGRLYNLLHPLLAYLKIWVGSYTKKETAGWKIRDCSCKEWTDEPALGEVFEDHLQNSWSISILILAINKFINSCKHLAMLFKNKKTETIRRLDWTWRTEVSRTAELLVYS